MEKRYIVGIDLGTTNSAVGYIDLHDVSPGAIEIKSFDIPQLVGMGRIGLSKTLPSFLYLPSKYDKESTSFALPWDENRNYAVGVFARDQGALTPRRLVSSAKSWLCHGGVDRDAPILPWGAGDDVEKVSPITASARYLQHIKEAWEYEMKAPLSQQDVVLTVPASFDQVARELTLQAAKEAGLENVVLLEEPLSSFYAWLSQHEDDWQELLRPGQVLIVVDVGGGTTDFTLISCEKGEKGPRLERVAVGDHLLLGGDNIDLAIAALCEKKIGRELTASEWQNLFHQARGAKETLLAKDGLEKTSVRLIGRGRDLVAGTISIELNREEIENAILEGFFPEVDFKDSSILKKQDSGLREMGLPYEKDPAVTRHLARFLIEQGKGRLPDVVLFNGGTLKPTSIRKRIKGVLSKWHGKEVVDIETKSLDLAISVGAVYYGLVRRGLGLRVGGGIARAYFIGIGSKKSQDKAICIIERGTEEGKEIEIDRQFQVITNRPVKFTLYSSTTRQEDHLGDVVQINEKDFVALPPLQTVLKYGKRSQDKTIPVKILSQVTTIGTLELYCKSLSSPHKWRLQFDLRAKEKKDKSKGAYQVEGVVVAKRPQKSMQEGLSEDDKKALLEAKELIQNCFLEKDKAKTISPKELSNKLSDILGMGKELWRMPLLRGLCDILLECKSGRKRSLEHESRWFNLTGFCLRPGIGHELDPWRIKKIWPLYFEGLFHVKKLEARLQWWIFWRRVCAGLSSGQQTQLFSMISPVLIPQKKGRRKKVKHFKPPIEEARQMWLFAANLERIDIEKKVSLGNIVLDLLPKSQFQRDLLWALGRLGARVPLYGPANKVVPASQIKIWFSKLKNMELKGQNKPLINCLVSMARICGDRARDLTTSDREEIALFLELLGAKPEEVAPLRELKELERAEQDRAFGENLPEGLILKEEE